MALVTVQRSPSTNNSPTSIDVTTGSQDDMDSNRNPKSLSECYFAGKGTALVLPAAAEAQNSNRRCGAQGSNIQKHLQSMFYLLRPEETLKMAVKLESVHPSRTRYLVVVSRMGNRGEESCLLGIDCNEKTTVGLVLRVMADTTIRLDGDGGFSVSVCGRHHIFKPVSVQAMWSALQTLHKVSSKAREQNYFQGGLTHDWVNYYEDRIESERSCLNEWHAMDNLESKRPPSPDSIRTKPTEREETEKVIRTTLKEIMMSVDLDEVTSKYIRSRLEEDLDMDLGEYKSFIDQEMLTILGQMDAPTEIFDHVYLGSEWNASNYEELQRNGVGHILNVTREIDNFFPGTFDYLNVRVYDDEKTDLLKHWDNTFKYITNAKKCGSKVLVHCKMGVSRSASVVIAYAMKAYNWDFQTALHHVKDKRTCIKPNTSFLSQLETYQGILDAMKNKEKLQRSKSETNLKLPSSGHNNLNNNNNNNNNGNNVIIISHNNNNNNNKIGKVLVGSEPTPVIQALYKCNNLLLQTTLSGQDLRNLGKRPKSWSPDNLINNQDLINLNKASPVFLSLEDLSQKSTTTTTTKNLQQQTNNDNKTLINDGGRHVLMPCDNGESYSVSPNQIVHLPAGQQQQQQHDNNMSTSVKERINELESNQKFTNITTTTTTTSTTTVVVGLNDDNNSSLNSEIDNKTPPMLRAVLVKKEIWDPGDNNSCNSSSTSSSKVSYSNSTSDNCDLEQETFGNNSNCVNNQTVWTSSTVLKNVIETDSAVPSNNNNNINSNVNNIINNKTSSNNSSVTLRKDGDPFSNQLDRVFDREEKKQQQRMSIIPIIGGNINNNNNNNNNNTSELLLSNNHDNNIELINNRECPSRQSSWSSYDSAVVLGSNNDNRCCNEQLSRHSSWGSGDTRILPSRNSSWGSYDMKPRGPVHYLNEKGEKILLNENDLVMLEQQQQQNNSTLSSSCGIFPYDKEDIPWHPGTVKRTKQKIENNSNESSSSETLMFDCSNNMENDDNNKIINEAINKCLISTTTTPTTTNKSAISDNIQINSSNNNIKEKNLTRLSVSAPETSTMELITYECPITLSRSTSNVSSNYENDSSSSSVISTAQCSSVKQHRILFLENLYKDNKNQQQEFFDNSLLINNSTTTTSSQQQSTGIVKNLKKEFEAKTSCCVGGGGELNPIINLEQQIDLNKSNNKIKSLPTSPILQQQQQQQENDIGGNNEEDLKFKNLLGIFEKQENNTQVNYRSKLNNSVGNNDNNKSRNNSTQQNRNLRYSCIEVSVEKSPVRITQTTTTTQQFLNNSKNDGSVEYNKRPPISPTVVKNTSPHLMVAATVIATAAKKQQQQFGKSHPLARLSIKSQRHNNPVYNTM